MARPVRNIQTCQDYLNSCRHKRNFLRSAQFRGTFYELAAIETLRAKLNFSGLLRTGGAGDNGVDLLGAWDLSSLVSAASCKTRPRGSLLSLAERNKDFDFSRDVKVLVQCKNSSAKIKATTVRELAGVREFHTNMNSSLDVNSNFMVLVSALPLTNQAQVQMQMSQVPMLHTRMIPRQKILEFGETDYDVANWSSGILHSVYINPYALRLLKGLDVESMVQKINKNIDKMAR